MNDVLEFPSFFPISAHTDYIGPGSTFIAMQGFHQNGIKFIPLALKKGARRIVVENGLVLPQVIIEMIKLHAAEVIYAEQPRRVLAQLSAAALDFPAKKLKVIAITGTKGKTSTSFILEHVLRSCGYRTALLSSAKNSILHYDFKTNLTTPQPDYLHVFFKLCVTRQVEFVIMETAAQAYSLERTFGLQFDAAIFTNFDLEHLEFYTNMHEYFAAKCKMITQLKDNAPLILNQDDMHIASLQKDYRTVNFAIQNKQVDFAGTVEKNSTEGISFLVRNKNILERYHIPQLMGIFNAYNLLAVVSLLKSMNIEYGAIRSALKDCPSIPGRMNKYLLPNKATCFIDKAHNPSSYQAVLSTLRPLTKHLIVVFGAGGERDKNKRPLMGKIAAQYADLIVLTSDDPRSEDPQQIMLDIQNGIDRDDLNKVLMQVDRELAIRLAYQRSIPGAIILLLGKGTDEYQLIGDKKIHFSEKEIIRGL